MRIPIQLPTAEPSDLTITHERRNYIMHLKENCNLEDFLNKVKKCRSKVTFETSEGDILAMQSTLCQLIFVSLQHQPALFYGGEIRCEDKEDYEILKDFLF